VKKVPYKKLLGVPLTFRWAMNTGETFRVGRGKKGEKGILAASLAKPAKGEKKSKLPHGKGK